MTRRRTIQTFLFFFLIFLLSPAGTPVMSMQDTARSSILQLSSALNGSPEYRVITNPPRLQEGFNTTITVEAHNAIANTTVTLNVTDPTGAFYTKTLGITINGTGFGSNATQYWSDFAEGANTNYVGLYFISVNGTIASGNFTVGLTDKPEYRRTETVFIRAAGYQPGENVTIHLDRNNISVTGFPKSWAANVNGVVADTWMVPTDATPGNYHISILSAAATNQTVKPLFDVATFTVLGAVCSVKAENLCNQTVANVVVEVYNATTNNFLNVFDTTNSSGWAQFNLEQGNYTFKALVKNVEVGNLSNLSVTVDNTFVIRLRLINLMVSVETEEGEGVPFITIALLYNYTTRDNETISGTVSMRTTLAGVAEVQNLFTNITYSVEARRYDALFNRTTIEFLPASPLASLRFELPNCWLNVHALDSMNQNASQIQIRVYELSSGVATPIQHLETDSNGDASFFLPFGKYRLRAYKDDAFLSEIVVDLVTTPLTFMFHLNTMSLRVAFLILDIFGQPIANAQVKIERKTDQEYVPVSSKLTDAAGSAIFDLPAGGNCLISVYIAGRLALVKEQFLDSSSNSVTFQVAECVAVIGFPLPASVFAVFTFIVILALFLLVVTRKQLAKVIWKELQKLTRKSLLHTSFVGFF